jgi:hypothetical protein
MSATDYGRCGALNGCGATRQNKAGASFPHSKAAFHVLVMRITPCPGVITDIPLDEIHEREYGNQAFADSKVSATLFRAFSAPRLHAGPGR